MAPHVGALPVDEARRLALSDDLCADAAGEVVVIGCGNPLRGDDAFGPTLIHHLWGQGVPEGVVLVDGGTAGMDVAFKLRGARHAVLVDAAATGSAPGTIFRVPGDELAQLPPIDGLHTHQFRWDHALAFARWLLGDQYPEQVTVYLVEVSATEHGADLSPAVAAQLAPVAELVRMHYPVDVEFTDGGYVRLDPATAARFFPDDALVAVPHGPELWLLPLVGPQAGGLLLKQRTPRGDRAALVSEALRQCGDDEPRGLRRALWDPIPGALRVALRP